MHSGLYGALEALLSRCEEVEGDTMLAAATLSDAAYLAAIQRHGRRGGVSGVARAIGVSQPSATDSICRLEERGLAHRIVQRGARSHAILLTQEGATVLSGLAASEEQVIAGVFDVLSADERQMLVGLISRIFSLSALPSPPVVETEGGAADETSSGQSSSAPSLASTTCAVQESAAPAAPLREKARTAEATLTRSEPESHLVNRGRPARDRSAEIQKPMHMGQPKK